MTELKRRDIFTVAAWVALFVGVLEGIVWTATRVRPALNAAHKMSPDALWVAPALNLPLFLLGALLLLPFFSFLQARLGQKTWHVVYGIFLSVGFYLVLTAPQVLGQIGAAFMSVGLAVVISRGLGSAVEPFTLRLRRRVWGIPAVLLLLWLGVGATQRVTELLRARALPASHAGSPNVLVLVMDTVRADRIQPWRDNSLTPNFDRLAAGGVRFDNALSTTSWSLPSQASILTGRYAYQHGADWPSAQMNKSTATLPEYFGAQGYVTGAFSGNAAWVTPEYLGRGFLRFRVYILEDLFRRTTLGRKIDNVIEKIGYHSAGRGKKAPQVNREFLEFLDHYPDRPFFAYLCYMDVNQEMHDRSMNKDGRVPEVVQTYDEALRRLDGHIGALLAELEKRGKLERTLLVLTSDHGESFGAEETADHDPSGHGTSLYREQSAVPLLVNYPGKIPAGVVSTRTVSLADIASTIVELLGGKDTPFTGESLSGGWRLQDSASGAAPAVLAELRHLDGKELQASAFRGTWQYLNTPRNFKKLKKGDELFDFSSDALSRKNLAGQPSAQPVLTELRDWLRLTRNPPSQKPASSTAARQ